MGWRGPRSLPFEGTHSRKSQDAPHLCFANATDDAKLVEFVRKWGPFYGLLGLKIGRSPSDAFLGVVGGPSAKHVYLATGPSVPLEVTQSLAELRREQK